MSDTLASIKERIDTIKARGDFDFLLVIDALAVLVDTAIAAQPHGPPAPTTEGTTDEAAAEK